MGGGRLGTVSTDQKQPASYFVKISVLFFQERLFFKEISRTHQIFQKNKKWHKNTYKFSRSALSKFYKNTYDFSGGKNAIRTDQIFQNIFVINFNRTHKIFQEKEIPKVQIKFSRRVFSKFFKNRYNFLGDHTPKNRYF